MILWFYDEMRSPKPLTLLTYPQPTSKDGDLPSRLLLPLPPLHKIEAIVDGQGDIPLPHRGVDGASQQMRLGLQGHLHAISEHQSERAISADVVAVSDLVWRQIRDLFKQLLNDRAPSFHLLPHPGFTGISDGCNQKHCHSPVPHTVSKTWVSTVKVKTDNLFFLLMSFCTSNSCRKVLHRLKEAPAEEPCNTLAKGAGSNLFLQAKTLGGEIFVLNHSLAQNFPCFYILKIPISLQFMKKWGHLLSSAYSPSHKWQEIAQRVNANQFPKQQPKPCTWESFQETTQVLMFGKKAEALSSHTAPYIWPPLALEGSADFEARVWELRSGREEQYLFHILQESRRLKAHLLNLQLPFLSVEGSSWRERKYETCSVQNGFKSTLYKDCLIGSSSKAGKYYNFCLPGCYKYLIVNKNTH